MKVFVCGGTGVIGWRAVKALVEAGHDVTALVRSEAKADLVRSLGATPAEVDLFDSPAVSEAVAGHRAVINLATKIPPAFEARKARSWADNDRIRIEGSRNLADAAVAAGAVRFIQESIAFLYRDHGDEWIDETSPNIDTPLTAAVDAAEANTKRFSESGGAGVVLRFGMFYAPDSVHTSDLLKYARRGWYLAPGKPGKYSAAIHADDAASAVVAALAAPAGKYNVSDDEPLTLRETAAVYAAALGRERVRNAPRVLTRMVSTFAPNLVLSQRVSNARFKDASDWAPKYPSLREGVPSVVGEVETAGAR